MKLEIELDLNKIDYDAINKQIAEKIAELDVVKEYEINNKIDREIRGLVEESVKYAYGKYLDTFWAEKADTTSKGENLVEQVAKEKIEDYTKETMDKIFASEYSEETMQEIMLQMIPDVFTALLFSRIDKALFSNQNNYWQMTQNRVRVMIAQAIGRTVY